MLAYAIYAEAQIAMTHFDQPFLNAGTPMAGLTQPTLIRTMTNTASGSPSSITLTGFSATGGNYALIAVATSTAANRTVTSITTGTGSQTATNIATATYQGATTGKAILYGVVNPTTGDIVVTMSGSCTIISATAMLFNNVGGSGLGVSDSVTSARTSTSDNLTTVATDLAVDSIAFNGSVGAPTKGASQTLIAQTPVTANVALIANSTQPGAAGTTTMAWTFASQVVTWVGVALNGK
jgi:hypothetical protein